MECYGALAALASEWRRTTRRSARRELFRRIADSVPVTLWISPRRQETFFNARGGPYGRSAGRIDPGVSRACRGHRCISSSVRLRLQSAADLRDRVSLARAAGVSLGADRVFPLAPNDRRRLYGRLRGIHERKRTSSGCARNTSRPASLRGRASIATAVPGVRPPVGPTLAGTRGRVVVDRAAAWFVATCGRHRVKATSRRLIPRDALPIGEGLPAKMRERSAAWILNHEDRTSPAEVAARAGARWFAFPIALGGQAWVSSKS